MNWLSLAFLLSILFHANAKAGNELGNGGDLVAQEFIAAGRQVLNELRRKPNPRIADMERLATLIETAKVSSQDTLLLDGKSVDAINYPKEKRIEVNRERWLKAAGAKRASLVLHEYLGLMEIQDDNYAISGSYASAFASPEEKPKNYEVGVFTTYGKMGSNAGYFYDETKSPGIAIAVGKKISPASTIGLRFEWQKFSNNKYTDRYKWTQTVMQLSASYKHSFLVERIFSPYVSVGAGIGSNNFGEFSERIDNRRFITTEFSDSNSMYLDFLLHAGFGMRYKLTDSLGLDLGLKASGLFPGVFRGYDIFGYWKSIAAVQAGLDYRF